MDKVANADSTLKARKLEYKSAMSSDGPVFLGLIGFCLLFLSLWFRNASLPHIPGVTLVGSLPYSSGMNILGIPVQWLDFFGLFLLIIAVVWYLIRVLSRPHLYQLVKDAELELEKAINYNNS